MKNMNHKMSPQQAELFKRIDEILFYIWDPIGVNSTACARDEYYSYVPVIYSIAQKKNCENEIAETLNSIQTIRIGLGSGLEHCKFTAEQIFEWSEILGFQK